MSFSRKIFTIPFLIFTILACKKEKENPLQPDTPILEKEIVLGIDGWSADTATKFLFKTLPLPTGYSTNDILSVYKVPYKQAPIKIDTVIRLGVYYKIESDKVTIYNYCPDCVAFWPPNSNTYAVIWTMLYIDGRVFNKVKIVFR
jgi:hypothetical protein